MTRYALASVLFLVAGCEIVALEDDTSGTDTTSECDDVQKVTFYADGDGDGYGTDVNTKDACEAPAGYVEDGGDCDDQDDTVSPDADEVCDGIDNNCDDEVDNDAIDAETFYADADGDGYGDAEVTEQACEPSSGFVSEAGDCNDSDYWLAEFCDTGARFASVLSANPETTIAIEDGDTTVLSATLSALSSTDHTDFEPGVYDVVLYEDGAEVWRAEDFGFLAGHRFTAAITDRSAIIKIDYHLDDDGNDLSAGEYRLNLTNVAPTTADEAAGAIYDSGYSLQFNQSLSVNQELIEILDTPDSQTFIIEIDWDLGAGGLIVEWDITDAASDADGGLLYAWARYTGSCSQADYEAGSFDCERELVTLDDDGTVSVAAENSYGWTQ